MEVQSHLVSFGAVGFVVGPAVGGHMAEMENGFHYVCCIVMLFFWANFGKYSTVQSHVMNTAIVMDL
jgi:hypothetical protein